MAKTNSSVKNKLCVSSMVLGIIGIVFSVILPVVSYACSIPGLVIAFNSKKKNYNTSAGLVLNIVALSLALINSILGVVMTIKMFLNGDREEKAEQ